MKYLYYSLLGLVVVAVILAITPIAAVILSMLLGIGLYRPDFLTFNKKTAKKGRLGIIGTYGTLSILAITILVIDGKFGFLSIPNFSVSSNEQEEIFDNLSGDPIEIHFIDVGQGDSILIDYGDFEMLIDAGDNSSGQDVIEYLHKQEVDVIDYMVATHMDADHIGGMDDVLEAFEILNIIDSGTEKDTQTYIDYKNARDTENAYYQEDDADIKIIVDENLWFKVIETGDTYKDENDNSVVIELNYKNRSVLFTGDMGEEAENHVLAAFKDVDVLKSGHHGSKSSSSEAFLNRVKPEYAIISSGAGNKYGHPHTEVLDRYDAHGIEVYRTDELGSIVLTINPNGEMIWKH